MQRIVEDRFMILFFARFASMFYIDVAIRIHRLIKRIVDVFYDPISFLDWRICFCTRLMVLSR